MTIVRAAYRAAIWDQTLIWRKNGHALGRSDYHSEHADILYGWKAAEQGTSQHRRPPAPDLSSVWPFDRARDTKRHPSMRPVALFANAIHNSTALGDVIVDPYLGTGTTLIAAEQLQRRTIGLDLEPAEIDTAIHRWQALTGIQAERFGADGEQKAGIRLSR